MSEKNSFKELEKELEKEFSSKKEKTKGEIKATVNKLSFVGNIFDLYISKFFESILGSNNKNQKNY